MSLPWLCVEMCFMRTFLGNQNRKQIWGLKTSLSEFGSRSRARTTDTQRENSLYCMAENSIPIPNFMVPPKHILSATLAQFSNFFDLCLHGVSVVHVHEEGLEGENDATIKFQNVSWWSFCMKFCCLLTTWSVIWIKNVKLQHLTRNIVKSLKYRILNAISQISLHRCVNSSCNPMCMSGNPHTYAR